MDRRGSKKMWLLFAVLSAVFAALTSIFAKIGIEGVNSNLATAIRTVVVLALAWGIVFLTGAERKLRRSARKAGFSDSFGAGDGRVVALLLPRRSAGRGFEGRSD